MAPEGPEDDDNRTVDWANRVICTFLSQLRSATIWRATCKFCLSAAPLRTQITSDRLYVGRVWKKRPLKNSVHGRLRRFWMQASVLGWSSPSVCANISIARS